MHPRPRASACPRASAPPARPSSADTATVLRGLTAPRTLPCEPAPLRGLLGWPAAPLVPGSAALVLPASPTRVRALGIDYLEVGQLLPPLPTETCGATAMFPPALRETQGGPGQLPGQELVSRVPGAARECGEPQGGSWGAHSSMQGDRSPAAKGGFPERVHLWEPRIPAFSSPFCSGTHHSSPSPRPLPGGQLSFPCRLSASSPQTWWEPSQAQPSEGRPT